MEWEESSSKMQGKGSGCLDWIVRSVLQFRDLVAHCPTFPSELEAAASNPYLYRAILRSLHRPLSVMLTNLSAQLVPVTSSTEFATHPSPAAPSSAQLYAVAFATFAAELLETLDSRGLFLPDNHGVGITDNLRGICESLESLIGRVIIPLVSGVRKELVPLINALEFNMPVVASPPPLPPILPKQATPQNKGVLAMHPSIGSLHYLIHSHARNLVQYTTPPTVSSQATLATLLISLIWHGLVALSRRAPAPRSSSVMTVSNQQTVVSTALRWKKAGGNTTTSTPPSPRFSLKLPPSRPPSPPSSPPPFPAMDARLLYNLFNVLPRPSEDNRYVLAREAVDEAFRGLASLCALLDYEAAGNLEIENLDGITTDLPTVIALPVLLRIFGRGEEEKGSTEAWDVPLLLGVTDQEYRSRYLGGFGMAEEGGPGVAKCILDTLVERHDAKCERLIQWLEGRANVGE